MAAMASWQPHAAALHGNSRTPGAYPAGMQAVQHPYGGGPERLLPGPPVAGQASPWKPEQGEEEGDDADSDYETSTASIFHRCSPQRSAASASNAQAPVSVLKSRGESGLDELGSTEAEKQQGGIGWLRKALGGLASKSTEESFDEADEEEEDECGRTDLAGLTEYLQQLQSAGVRAVEVTYIVNTWKYAGMVPMKHHGFNFKTTQGENFSLDFSRKGIVWDTYGDEPPDNPDNTVFEKTYSINVEPERLQRYCEATKPFAWFTNDCDTWSKGLMAEIGIAQDEEPAMRRSRPDVCGASPLPGGSGYAAAAAPVARPSPVAAPAQSGQNKQGSGRRQRKDACV